MSKENPRPWKYTDMDGQPREIADGDYLILPKARPQRMELNSLSKEARQVYACMDLHTMAFQRETAVILENGKERALTLADVQRETQLELSRIRRAFRKELEPQDLAKRRPIDGGPLKKGNIELVSGATPKRPEIFTENVGHARPTFPDWFPETWAPLKRFIRRLKVEVPAAIEDARALHSRDEADREEAARVLILRGEAVALDLEKAEKAARAFAVDVSAHPDSEALIRKKEIERKSSSSEALPVAPLPPEPTTTTPPSLESRIVAVFVGAGKDNPTPQQMRGVVERLPGDPRAGDAFVETLQSKIGRIKHPGALDSVMRGFLLRWPAILKNFEERAATEANLERKRKEAEAWRAENPEPEPAKPEPSQAETIAPVIDEEREASRRETLRARKEAEKAAIEERRKQLRKPAESEHAEPAAKARGAT